MNIQIHLKKKGIGVIKITFALLLFISCTAQKNIIDSDYLILNNIIETTIKNKDDFTIKLSNNNKFIISIIHQLKKYENTPSKLIEEKHSLGIKKNKVQNHIFNRIQYENFLLQEEDSIWYFDNSIVVNKKNILKNDGFFMKSKEIFISKPIYTINKKYALVHINKSTISYIMILHKRDNKWFKIDNIAFHIK